MPRSRWSADILIVATFAVILAVLSVVNTATLRSNYEQTERLQVVNRVVDCLDPTTACGKKLAQFQEEERKFLVESMRSQAICTLLTSRTLQGNDDVAELERVYNDCVAARAVPPPDPPTPPVVEED